MRAEGTVLHREHVRGMRLPDAPPAWDCILLALETGTALENGGGGRFDE